MNTTLSFEYPFPGNAPPGTISTLIPAPSSTHISLLVFLGMGILCCMSAKIWWLFINLLLVGAAGVAYWPAPALPANRLGQHVLGTIPVCVRSLAAEDRWQVTAALFFWREILADVEWEFTTEQALLLTGSTASPDYVRQGDHLLYGRNVDWIWEAYAAPRQNLAVFENRFAGLETRRFTVAVHEIGHLLGLPHNRLTNSVMYPDELDAPEFLLPSDLRVLADKHPLRKPITGPIPIETGYLYVRPHVARSIPLLAGGLFSNGRDHSVPRSLSFTF